MRYKPGILLTSAITAAGYALLTKLAFQAGQPIVSVTYLFFLPLLLGMIPFLFSGEEKLISRRNILVVPFFTVLIFFATLYLAGANEIICFLILAPPFVVFSYLGALLCRRVLLHRTKNKAWLLLSFIPIFLLPMEGFMPSPASKSSVKSELDIAASPEYIWKHIVEVSTIHQWEYDRGLFNELGIPSPVEASVSKKALGGLRLGRFKGGLHFIEHITAFVPDSLVSFSIKVDPKTVNPGLFDQYVLNGNYFAFVDASYKIEKTAKGSELSLTSQYRLQSNVNFFGKFWADIILKDFQDRLLAVIKERCEEE